MSNSSVIEVNQRTESIGIVISLWCRLSVVGMRLPTQMELHSRVSGVALMRCSIVRWLFLHG